MNIAEAIKKCALEAYDAELFCDVVFGVVISEDPVRIKVGEMIVPDEIFSLTDNLVYKKTTVSIGVYDREIVINEGVKPGDNLVVLRKRGGEEYIAIGRIGDNAA